MIIRLSDYSEFYDEDMLSAYEYSAKNSYEYGLKSLFKYLRNMKIKKSSTDPTIVVSFTVIQMLSYYSECEESLINYVKNDKEVFDIQQTNLLNQAFYLANNTIFITNNNCRRYKKLARLKNVHRI